MTRGDRGSGPDPALPTDGWGPLPGLSFRDLYLPASDYAGLHRIALAQDGLFTVDQGRACGFSRALLSHYARAGRFRRLRRGIYRWPRPEEAPEWWRGIEPMALEPIRLEWMALGPAHAVVSHSAALKVLGLLDEWDGQVHLILPRGRRGTVPSRAVQRERRLQVHLTPIPVDPVDLDHRYGIAVTRAERSIVDAAKEWTGPRSIEEAVRRALEAGAVESIRLAARARARGHRVGKVVEAALGAAGAPTRRPARWP